MTGTGHNNGPELDGPIAWRRFAWTKARADLLPTLPIEVVRLRVMRAQELGLPYRTYAGIRAHTGRDVIGFLFSSNALAVLRVGQAMAQDRRDRLAGLIGTDRTGVVHLPLDPAAFVPPLDAAVIAPRFTDTWSAMRDQIAATIRARGLPADACLLVGETAFERDWAQAGRMAGFLSGAHYFAKQG